MEFRSAEKQGVLQLEHADVGAVRLGILGDRGPETEAAIAYWENEVSKRDELSFPRVLKELWGDRIDRRNADKVAQHVAQFVSAELTGLACERCGQPLPPVPVGSRAEARKVWSAQHSRFRTGITCDRCRDRVQQWIDKSDRLLPQTVTLDVLLSALALRQTAEYGARIPGFALKETLSFPDVAKLASTLLVPEDASLDAVVFKEDGKAFCDPEMITWMFAGEGMPQQRLQAADDFLDRQYGEALIARPFDEIVDAAVRCIEDEVLHYIDFHVDERRWDGLDDQQEERVRQLVRENWGPLNLGMFYNLLWNAFRSAANLKSFKSVIPQQKLRSYIVNEFAKGIARMLKGEWERREYVLPSKMAHRPRSLILFRMLLNLDVMTVLPEDVERLRPEPAGPDGESIQRTVLEFIQHRVSELSGQRADLLERFGEVYRQNGQATDENAAFAAAQNGLALLDGFVPKSTVDAVRDEVQEMRDSAVSMLSRS